MPNNQHIVDNVNTYSERAIYVKVNRALKREGRGRQLFYMPRSWLAKEGHGPYFVGPTLVNDGRVNPGFSDLHQWAAENMPDLFTQPKRAHEERPYVMPWGRHEGESFASIPLDYLYWVARTMVGDRRHHVLAVLAARALANQRWQWKGETLEVNAIGQFLRELGRQRVEVLRERAQSLLSEAEHLESRLPGTSFEAVAEAAGYQPYPGYETEYMVRYEDGEAVETFELADVKAKLRYAA